MKKTLIVLAAASALSAAARAETEIVTDARDYAFPANHSVVTAFGMWDQTDNHNELVVPREWTMQWNERNVTNACPVLDVRDSETGSGTVFLRLSPLPHARPVACNDFILRPGFRKVSVVSNGYPCVVIRYTGGDIGRTEALHRHQRLLRPYKPGRDGLLLSNTWGDGNSDTRINERFVLDEIRAGAALGIDVVEIDDGWQKGRSANSLINKSKKRGAWNGYWAFDPHFWDADPARFPGGFPVLAAETRRCGVKLGLWFGPDSSDEAANWKRDADLLLGYFRDYGIAYYKIDSMKTTTPLSLERQRAFFDELKRASGGDLVCDLDVTAEIRPGYFGLPDVGTLFVENRYAKHCSYWPHLTLRNLWMLSALVDPVRLRMEFCNPLRLPERYDERYPGSPLAPARWRGDAVFATVLVASPLAWFEVQNLAPETAAEMRPLIAKWKEERANLHGGFTFPVGAKPDGFSWTGFVTRAADGQGGYALLFREASRETDWSLDIRALLPGTTKTEVLSGRGTCALANGRLSVSVPAPLDYIWVRIR